MLGATLYRHWLELRFLVLATLGPWLALCAGCRFGFDGRPEQRQSPPGFVVLSQLDERLEGVRVRGAEVVVGPQDGCQKNANPAPPVRLRMKTRNSRTF